MLTLSFTLHAQYLRVYFFELWNVLSTPSPTEGARRNFSRNLMRVDPQICVQLGEIQLSCDSGDESWVRHRDGPIPQLRSAAHAG